MSEDMKIEPKLVEYFIGDELDPYMIWWYDSNGVLVDFGAEPHSFMSRLQRKDTTPIDNPTEGFDKDTGITGLTGTGTPDSGSPNVKVEWPVALELNTITAPGLYVYQVTAHRTLDNKERTFEGEILMKLRFR